METFSLLIELLPNGDYVIVLYQDCRSICDYKLIHLTRGTPLLWGVFAKNVMREVHKREMEMCRFQTTTTP